MADDRNPRMSSVLGETAVVIGNIEGSTDVEIRGRVQGNIQLTGRVFISEAGTVQGNIEAHQVTVAGMVRGDVTAEDAIFIQAPGRIQGSLSGPRVAIEAGARVHGILRTGDDLEKSAEAPQKAPDVTSQLGQSPPPVIKAKGSPVAPTSMNAPLEKAPRKRNAAPTPTSALKDDVKEKSTEEVSPTPPRQSVDSSAVGQTTDEANENAVEPASAKKKAKRRLKPKRAGAPPAAPQADNAREGGDNTDSSNEKNDVSSDKPTTTTRGKKPRPTAPRRRGPPQIPTFVQGTKSHKRS